MDKLSLTIGHFYPDLLNLYGDRGNVLALLTRAQRRGIEVNVKEISIGDELDPGSVDIAFLGGGQDNEQNILKDDLVHVKGQKIKNMIENGTVFLCICGGYQMLGKYYLEHNGNKLECLGAIDIYTEGEKERYIQDTVYELELSSGEKVKVVGFENHSGRTYLGESVKPFMKVLRGAGNNGKDGMEGVHYKNTFGTYSHGSLLPKNPEITDLLIETALKKRLGEDYQLPVLDDTMEKKARELALSYIENGKEQMI